MLICLVAKFSLPAIQRECGPSPHRGISGPKIPASLSEYTGLYGFEKPRGKGYLIIFEKKVTFCKASLIQLRENAVKMIRNLCSSVIVNKAFNIYDKNFQYFIMKIFKFTGKPKNYTVITHKPTIDILSFTFYCVCLITDIFIYSSIISFLDVSEWQISVHFIPLISFF